MALLAANAHVAAVKETMRRENIAGRVGAPRDAAGPDFSVGLSSDVQLLAREYATVWRLTTLGSATRLWAGLR